MKNKPLSREVLADIARLKRELREPECIARARRDETVGRWMRLESVLQAGMDAEGRGGHGQRRRFRARANTQSSWVVCIKGTPEIGAAIRVSKVSGPSVTRYVERMIVPAHKRTDGSSIVYVSKRPVAPREAQSAPVAAPLPTAPVLVKQRNPRICEECEGPCRPGAGMCDSCKSE